jgi:hypothetical protein
MCLGGVILEIKKGGHLDFKLSLAFSATFVLKVLFKYTCHRMVQMLIGELWFSSLCMTRDIC